MLYKTAEHISEHISWIESQCQAHDEYWKGTANKRIISKIYYIMWLPDTFLFFWKNGNDSLVKQLGDCSVRGGKILQNEQ